MAVTGKIDRKYMAHYIDAGSLCGGVTPKYERLGKDLEEYNVELNPDTETSKNILGESTFKHNGYEVSSDADEGINSITFVKSDGTKVGPVTVKNGSKGSTGTIKSVTAAVDANVGIPQVTAKAKGDPSNADITFEFKNLKGNPGTISAVTAVVDNTSVDTGDPECVVELGGTPENRSFNLVFSHLVGTQGVKGDTGYYFTPAVDALGNLSWNNNGELNNPATVNIKGPKGDGGTVEITSVVIDNGSSETATPSVEVISGTTDP